MEKKYLLSEKYDDLALDLVEVQEFLATEKSLPGDLDKTHHLMGIGSPLLNIATLALYDQEDLIKKYPNGVVTENFVLIPAEQFKQVKENATVERPNSYMNGSIATGNLALFLNKYMLNFLEVTLNIEIPIQEKQQIEDNLLKSLNRATKIITTQDMVQNKEDRQIIKISEEPENSTNREILKLIEGKGYYIEERLKNSISLEQDVKEALKNNESYIKNIEVLQAKTKEISITSINEKMSIEDFSDIVEKSVQGKVSKVLPLKIVNKKVDNLIKKYDLDIEGFINASKNDLFPFMTKLEPLQFKLSMEHIFKEVFYSNIKDTKNTPRFLNKDVSEIKKNFAVELVKGCNEVQREYLITVITGFDMLSSSSFKLSSGKKFKCN